MAELLFWPALLAPAARRPPPTTARRAIRAGCRAATWGVGSAGCADRAADLQAVSADGFRGELGRLANFVWLVVGIYLVWGCNSRFRLRARGPAACGRAVRARLRGGRTSTGATGLPSLFLVLHVGLVLAAFAGFTLRRALSALYLWQERGSRREPGILRVTIPSLSSLDELAARTILVALRCRSGSRSGSCACAPTAAASTR
jgi:hypothetical protein